MSIILYAKQPSSKGKGHLINSTSQSKRLCNPCSSESSTSIPHYTPCGLIMIAKSTHIDVISHNCTTLDSHLLFLFILFCKGFAHQLVENHHLSFLSFFIYYVLIWQGLLFLCYYKLVWFYWTISLFCCFIFLKYNHLLLLKFLVAILLK
jgi:hypothetical protein